ncbi:MAG: DUF6600 domain-containing protein, partial [Pseudomonadota bacterium]
AGRWTVWYGDNCWIPDEPFGYVTHHYGSWVFVDGADCWYWSPPAAYVRGGPASGIGFGWYPGRVSWIYTDYYVGWVPLTPYETYYSRHYWGPGCVVVTQSIIDTAHNDHHHRHERHAVVVNQNHFYNVTNYNHFRVKNIDRDTLRNKYRKAGVVNEQVIKKIKDIRDKYAFSTIKVHEKPHQTVLERIQQNLTKAKRSDAFNAHRFEEKVDKIKKGRLLSGIDIQPRNVTNKIVPESQASKPRHETTFRTHELKKPENASGDKTGAVPRGGELTHAPGELKEAPAPHGERPKPYKDQINTGKEKAGPPASPRAEPARPLPPRAVKELTPAPHTEEQSLRPGAEVETPGVPEGHKAVTPQRYERPVRPLPQLHQPGGAGGDNKAQPGDYDQPVKSFPGAERAKPHQEEREIRPRGNEQPRVTPEAQKPVFPQQGRDRRPAPYTFETKRPGQSRNGGELNSGQQSEITRPRFNAVPSR